MNIKTKMLVYILLTIVLIFTLSVGYISYHARSIILDEAEQYVSGVVHENALRIEKSLLEDLSLIRTLAQVFAVNDDLDTDVWKNLFEKMSYQVISKSNTLFGISSSWETEFYDTEWSGDSTRYFLHMSKDGDGIHVTKSVKDLNNEIYRTAKNKGQDMMSEPRLVNESKSMMAYLISPIYKDDIFAGYVVGDVASSRFEPIIRNIKPWESTKVFLTSNSCNLLWYEDSDFYKKTVFDYNPRFEEQFNLSEYIKYGKSGIFRGVDENNSRVVVAVAPIQVGDYKLPWALTLVVPIDVILKDANRVRNISIIVGAIGILLITLIIFYISTNMSTAMVRTTEVLEKLSTGNTDGITDLSIKRGDEIEEMANSVNNLTKGLKETSVFAEQIGEGNFDAEFTPLSDSDVLGNALLKMRKSLQHAVAEESKRKAEDEKQNWATHGLAKFGEILRNNTTNINLLSFEIMSNLITYLDVNQGALFIIEDTQEEEKIMEMKTAIAYGRDKFMNKNVVVGEGLIGRCAFEKKSIYITDIPQNYINITSGMGTANPNVLLLVPLILNDEIFGVIEIASFHEIFEYQIEFIEKLGESIASTIASVKVNETTSKLLNQSKVQAEELASQEEEMRQNLEELQTTQEEAARREYEMAETVNALGAMAFTVEYDLDGTILSCNNKYADALGMSPEDIIGQTHKDGYDFDDDMKANYDLLWGDLKRGESKNEISKINTNNKEIWVEETYIPINNQSDNKPYKILKIGFDITEQKSKEIDFKKLSEYIEKDNLHLVECQNKIKELQDKLTQLNKRHYTKVDEELSQVSKTNKSIKETKPFADNMISWIPDFEMNINEIDEQHKQLIILANVVYTSFIQNKNRKEIKDNLKSFIDFASYHFGKEEQYFEQFDYSDATNHILEHKTFLKKVKQLQTDYSEKKTQTLNDLMSYIKEWLFNHLTNIDSKYRGLFE